MALQDVLRVARQEATPVTQQVLAATRPQTDTFRLDPLSHLDAGHVLIKDLVTKQPVPFRPYDHEVELVDAWVTVEGEGDDARLVWHNVHGEKSRQMGWTWTTAWILLYALKYWPVALLAQHVDLGRIDDGGRDSTPDSLFGKIRYMASQRDTGNGLGWPEWDTPADYLSFRQSPEHVITNRLTGAYLTGRGEDDDPGRGGTFDAYLGDEFARIPHDDAVQASIVSACPEGRLYISTPFGEDNLFHELREARSPEITYLRHHWSIHPVYGEGKHIAGADPDCPLCAANRAGVVWTASEPVAHRYPGKVTSPWYDRMVIRLLDEETIAQELDINYARALSARVYPEFQEEVHVVPHIAYDDNVAIELSIDYGWSPSSTSIGIWQDAPDSLRKIGDLEVFEHTPEQVVAALHVRLDEIGVPPMQHEPQFLRQMLAIGDPSGESAELGTGESLVVQYRKSGLEIVSKRFPVRQTIVSMKRLLYGVPKPVRYSASGCEATIKHMKANRWPTDRRGRRKQGASAPQNDEHNHMARADAYYAAFKYPAPQVDEQMNTSGFVADPELPYYRLSVEEARALRTEAEGDPGLQPGMRL